jgi:enamine deaminase RidA (YjgF/YER057c/UK114 family)
VPRELINPESLHPAPGFSHITVAEGSKIIYFAGQVALDREFNLVGGDDLRAQTVAAMRNDPAQTIAGVTGLALPGLMIEVEATASV